MRPRRLAVAAALLAIGGCAGDLGQLAPGGRANLAESDEAGIWMVSDRAEQELISSGRLVDDPRLQAYVREVGCRVSPEYCDDLRLYVVESTGFNAGMFPNGFMTVWSGLLLRIENEAQLAGVLGHEIGHYQNRHTLERWRDVKLTTTLASFLSIAAAVSGYRGVGQAARLLVALRYLTFSRDQEREADQMGVELMTAAGYDPREAAKVWEYLLAERAATGDDISITLFSTHPGAEERVETIRQLAAELNGEGDAADLGRERYLAQVRPLRARWIEDELQRGKYDGLEVVLDRWLDAGIGRGELQFYRGELHRRRDEDGDLGLALRAYRAALRHDDVPIEIHRSIGLTWWNRDDAGRARRAFEHYLDAVPGADDAALIRSYIERLS